MPALIMLVGASAAGGFSIKASTLPVAVHGYNPELGGILDRSQGYRRFPASFAVELNKCSDVDLAQHVGVHHNERLVADARLAGREGDSARGVKRSFFDDVVEPYTRAQTIWVGGEKGIRSVPEREHHLVDAVQRELRPLAR